MAPMSPIVLYIPLNKAIILYYILVYTLILIFLDIVGAIGAIGDSRVHKCLYYGLCATLEGVTQTLKNVTVGTVTFLSARVSVASGRSGLGADGAPECRRCTKKTTPKGGFVFNYLLL